MQSEVSSKEEQVKRYLSHQDKSSQKSFQDTSFLIRCRRQHLQAIKQRKYSRLTFVENTISNSPNVPSTKFLGSDRLFEDTHTHTYTSLIDLHFRGRSFVSLIQKKEVSSNELFSPAKVVENHGNTCCWTRYLQCGIYRSIPTWTQ